MKIVKRAAALFLFLALFTTGCSSFDRAWRNPPATIRRHRRTVGRAVAERAQWA